MDRNPIVSMLAAVLEDLEVKIVTDSFLSHVMQNTPRPVLLSRTLQGGALSFKPRDGGDHSLAEHLFEVPAR